MSDDNKWKEKVDAGVRAMEPAIFLPARDAALESAELWGRATDYVNLNHTIELMDMFEEISAVGKMRSKAAAFGMLQEIDASMAGNEDIKGYFAKVARFYQCLMNSIVGKPLNYREELSGVDITGLAAEGPAGLKKLTMFSELNRARSAILKAFPPEQGRAVAAA